MLASHMHAHTHTHTFFFLVTALYGIRVDAAYDVHIKGGSIYCTKPVDRIEPRSLRIGLKDGSSVFVGGCPPLQEISNYLRTNNAT